jgi:hypothetical protein
VKNKKVQVVKNKVSKSPLWGFRGQNKVPVVKNKKSKHIFTYSHKEENVSKSFDFAGVFKPYVCSVKQINSREKQKIEAHFHLLILRKRMFQKVLTLRAYLSHTSAT